MAETIIASYFENNGVPVIGLAPEIRIWEVSATGNNLIIGSTQGTQNPGPIGGGAGAGTIGTNGIMEEIYDNAADDTVGTGPAGSQDGFYRYVFDTINGYDPTKCYVFRVDGGASLTAQERYQVGELSIVDNADALVDLIYDEPAVEHTNSGTVGELINNTNASTNSLLMTVQNVQALVELAVKYQANRTEIDAQAATLTIFDSDCVTPLRVFNLLDSDGNPSITQVCNRVPVSATDGLPTC